MPRKLCQQVYIGILLSWHIAAVVEWWMNETQIVSRWNEYPSKTSSFMRFVVAVVIEQDTENFWRSNRADILENNIYSK